nr:DUF3006 domain-containing protein [uncultured Agathobaculum sp.]
MKQTGIVDRFEGDTVVVEIGGRLVNFPRAGAPSMLAEGMVVVVQDGRIAEIDQIETQRIEDDMRRRFERILGKQTDE